MNDEIKEFIEFRADEDGTYFYYIDKNGDEQWGYNLDNLKDYITNLQKENEELKKNQRYYKNGVFSLKYDKETLSDMVDDYKSRIEKAVELIKNKLSFETHQHLKKLYDDIDSIEEIWEDYEFEDLLNILSGGNNE